MQGWKRATNAVCEPAEQPLKTVGKGVSGQGKADASGNTSILFVFFSPKLFI